MHVASYTRALACMGKRGHSPPPWKCCNVFVCSNSYSKTFGRIIYIHYFHNQSSAWHLGLRRQTPPKIHSWTPLGEFRPQSAQTPNLPTPWKNPACAHNRTAVDLTLLHGAVDTCVTVEIASYYGRRETRRASHWRCGVLLLLQLLMSTHPSQITRLIEMPECFADITDDIVREHLQPGRTLQDELDVRIWPSIYLDYVLLNLLDTDRYGLLSCVTIAFIIVLYWSIQVQSCKCVYNKLTLTYLLTYILDRHFQT